MQVSQMPVADEQLLYSSRITETSLFRKLIENSHEGISLLNHKFEVLFSSASVERTSGWVNTNLSFLASPQLIHRDDWRDVKLVLEKVIQLPGAVETLIFRSKHRDGYYIWLECTYTNALYEPGIEAIICNFRDITEAKRSEESYKTELKILNDMLEQKAKELAVSNADLEQFAYIASHDLQEPLRMVTGFLGQINKKYGDLFDDKGKQYMYYAVDGATRMRQIILDLLDYSRVGRMDDKRERVDLHALVLEITGLFRKQVEELTANIEVEQLPALNTFRGPVRQILQNLIGNALKYHHAGSAPAVKISVEDKDDQWKFSVTDNGIGIPPAHLKEIFLPFKRLHTREEYPGTGMGLAITKKIVENLCGSISVKSVEGGGSMFCFTLPKT